MPKSLKTPTKGRALLIRQDDKLGEALLITPTLRAFKEALPDWTLDVWVGERWTRVLENNPYVNSLNGIPFRPRGQAFGSLLKRMRSGRYDAVLILRPQSAFYTLMARLASIPIRIGSAKQGSFLARLLTHNAYVAHDAQVHQVVRNLKHAELIAGDSLPHFPLQFALSHNQPATSNSPTIVLHLGVGGANRAWELERFAETARILSQQLPELAFVLTGSASDAERARNALPLFPEGTLNRMGQTDLEEMAQTLKAADLLISVDTGVVHLAAALQTPCVTLHPKREYPPERWHAWQSPYKAVCPTRYCPSCTAMRCAQTESDCVETILPEQVAQSALALIAETRSLKSEEGLLCE
ncbi:MAG: glycosyltransferase family 9 protein [Fimbriimonadia bacterium]|nr:glycosyltransferase family 9 protein [Fimbriimonadia bacterium]